MSTLMKRIDQNTYSLMAIDVIGKECKHYFHIFPDAVLISKKLLPKKFRIRPTYFGYAKWEMNCKDDILIGKNENIIPYNYDYIVQKLEQEERKCKLNKIWK